MKCCNFSRRLALTFAIGICASLDVAAAQQQWTTYMNPRFGTIADYPADIFTVRDPPPENGDGQGFGTEDGRAHLSIYGTRNVESDTPANYVQKYVDRQGITYKRATARFYIVSGARDADVFYERCNFHDGSNDIIDCFSVTYPAREKAVWDPIATRLSKSLRGGRGRH